MSAIKGKTTEEYYNDSTLWGDYQYTSLKDIVNSFMTVYVGDNKLISNLDRFIALFWAKRGLQEFNYDILKEIKAIELDLNDALTITMPDDMVHYVRVSWVDSGGNFHPMIINEDTKIAQAYLQDNEFNILFDIDGNPLLANENSYDPVNFPDGNAINNRITSYADCFTESYGGRFGLDTAKANANGWFTFDKKTGVMKFSSNVKGQAIVVEYVSDGLESNDESEIKIHKYAVEALYRWIKWNVLDNLDGIQEYKVKRARSDYYNERRKAMARIKFIKYNELAQVLRGRDKRIK